MRKIHPVFCYGHNGRYTEAVNPGCEWVLAGEGVPTRKWDGTCCLLHRAWPNFDRKFYRRLKWDAEKGPPPAKWIHHTLNLDERSGHGWLEVGDGPEDWQHRQAMQRPEFLFLPEGTYELVGQRIGKNPERLTDPLPLLVRHGNQRLSEPVRTFHGFRDWLSFMPYEGAVFHHPDGRMAKVTRHGFGLGWPMRPEAEVPA